MDDNNDGVVSFEEFQLVFKMAPEALPTGIKELVDVGSFFMRGLGTAADVGIYVTSESTKAAAAGVIAVVDAAASAFRPTSAQLEALFMAFDADGSGYIDLDELMAALQRGGKRMSREEAADILAQVDINQDGVVSFDEFVEVFEIAPDALPPGLKQLVDVSAVLAGSLSVAADFTVSSVDLVASGLSAVASAVGSMVGIGEFDIRETELSRVRPDESHRVRKAASMADAAWIGAGDTEGVQIWRIDALGALPWPMDRAGQWHAAHTYIILHTHKENFFALAYSYDVYYLLGRAASHHDAAMAWVKAHQLDDLLDNDVLLHREVMHAESVAFCALFPQMVYLHGSVASAFKRAAPHAYRPRLLRATRTDVATTVVEVTCRRDDLNSGGAFVLDSGETIYVWAGEYASPFDKLAASLYAESLEEERDGLAHATVTIDDAFWTLVGGRGRIRSTERASEGPPSARTRRAPVLLHVADSAGRCAMAEMVRGTLRRDMLQEGIINLVDVASELFVWVGARTPPRERAAAFNVATAYLKQHGKPLTTPVTLIRQGQGERSFVFRALFVD